MWGRVLGSQQRLLAIAMGRSPAAEPPPRPIDDGELTAELVDLRLPPHPYGRSLVLRDELANGASGAALAMREAFAGAWAAHVLDETPPRLSLRDPFALADETRAARCAFNASGAPTVRLACDGHASWHVREQTQRQQTCTRQAAKSARSAGGVGPVAHR
jgi:hypothetical protein